METLQHRIENLESTIQASNLYKDEALPGLEEVNAIFTIGIDFQAEWKEFCRCV